MNRFIHKFEWLFSLHSLQLICIFSNSHLSSILGFEAGSLQQLQEALVAKSDGSAAVDVNARSLYGRTSLHIATSVGKDLMEILSNRRRNIFIHSRWYGRSFSNSS